MKQLEEEIFMAISEMEDEIDEINLPRTAGVGIININIKKEDERYSLSISGREIAQIVDGKIEYNIEELKNVRKILEQAGYKYDDLGLPDIEYLEELEKDKEPEQEEELAAEEEKTDEEEQGEEEKADEEEPELEDDEEEIEEIARRYNVNSNQVVHISKDERVTKDHRFDGLANFAKGYDDIYIIQGDDPYSWITIGVREGQEEEIDNQTFRQMAGKNPDITIKRIDGEEIEEIKPLAIYEIDSQTAVAIVKNNFGEPEALYCRQEGGDEKTYWGSIIPEASGKNVLQKDPETRDFISSKNNSSRDLIEKADELDRAKRLEERGVPSKKEGVQVDEIDGTPAQNRQYYKEQIIEDLYKRLGIDEKMKNAMPGYLQYMEKKIDRRAEKVLRLMEENEDITYEEAVERVERDEGDRDKGGQTPDKPRKREH